MKTSSIEMRRPGHARRTSFRNTLIGADAETADTLDKRFPPLSEAASLGVSMPEIGGRKPLHSTLYSRRADPGQRGWIWAKSPRRKLS